MRCLIYSLSVFLVLLNLMLVHRLFHGQGDWHQYQALRAGLSREREVQEELLHKNLRLRAEIADLRDGREVLAEIARYDLGLVREGEFFIYLVGDPEKTVPQRGSSVSPLSGLPEVP